MKTNESTLEELELYIHIPFCIRKCRYCDFLSWSACDDEIESYMANLLREIAYQGQQYRKYQVTSIFIGGGTPSSVNEKLIADMMSALRTCFQLTPDAEITMECNPGTLSVSKLNCYREAGINRISMGLQSADNEELALLGRIHTYEDFLQNYEDARKCGFQNINIDLMAALPGQTTASYESTVKKVLRLHPEHISAYSLIIEENTPFYKLFHEDDERRERGENTILLPAEDTEREMYHLTEELLKESGYIHYEISNYAKEGYECRHNVGYWTRKNYLGLGLGAASLIENVRFHNSKDMEKYLHSVMLHEDEEILSQKEQMEEFMFLGLRMADGVSKGDFYDSFGQSLNQVYGATVNQFVKEKLLSDTRNRIRLTEKGIDISNYVMSEFLL